MRPHVILFLLFGSRRRRGALLIRCRSPICERDKQRSPPRSEGERKQKNKRAKKVPPGEKRKGTESARAARLSLPAGVKCRADCATEQTAGALRRAITGWFPWDRGNFVRKVYVAAVLLKCEILVVSLDSSGSRLRPG